MKKRKPGEDEALWSITMIQIQGQNVHKAQCIWRLQHHLIFENVKSSYQQLINITLEQLATIVIYIEIIKHVVGKMLCLVSVVIMGHNVV